jgi:hypothetical protein
MCYNCGCHIPQDNMGNPQNITDSTFQAMAKAHNITELEVKKQVYDYLVAGKTDNTEFEEMFSTAAKTWGQSVEEAKKETLKLLKTQVN